VSVLSDIRSYGNSKLRRTAKVLDKHGRGVSTGDSEIV
jgi:hypothetical protein